MTANEQDQKDAPESQTPDLDVIVPTPETLEIAGKRVTVNRLKTREFLALMRIITRGLGPAIARMNLDEENAQQSIAMALFMALPEGADDVIGLLQDIVQPVGRSEHDAAAVREALENPDLGDLMDIVAVVFQQEQDDIRSLVGKARQFLAVTRGTFSRN